MIKLTRELKKKEAIGAKKALVASFKLKIHSLFKECSPFHEKI